MKRSRKFSAAVLLLRKVGRKPETHKWLFSSHFNFPTLKICSFFFLTPLKKTQEFPSSPVVRTWEFNCHGPGFSFWLEK